MPEATGPADQPPETVATYLRLRGLPPTARTLRRRRRSGVDDENAPFTPGRDPHGIADVMADLSRESGWDAQLAQEDVMRTWADVAGETTAAHTTPVGFRDGVLSIACDSTAWATQLRIMRTQIVTEIARQYPDAGVESLRFLPPDVPSWKYGRRAVAGRGPRDTYG